MREAQVQHLSARMEMKLAELQRGRAVSVSHALVACGQAQIVATS